MTEKIKTAIKETIKSNMKGYILILSVFFAGVFLSFALNISSGSEEEIKLYINDFISNVKTYSVDSAKTFRLAMMGNIKMTVVFLVMSLTVVGSAGTLICVFIRGFSYGAVFFAIFNMSGLKAILFFLCAILPHALITMPCFMAYSLFCLKNSYALAKGPKELRYNIIKPILYALVCMAILCISALIQAYFEPVMIRMMKL